MADPASFTDADITVRQASYWQPVAVDTDGTPLWHGERMIEVRPGVWTTPDTIAVEAWLAERLADLENPDG